MLFRKDSEFTLLPLSSRDCRGESPAERHCAIEPEKSDRASRLILERIMVRRLEV
jgi:hypothetical protein